MIKAIKNNGNSKIAYVVAVPSFKDTVKKVFKSIKELKNIDVVSPTEATKREYDVIIVDEAHRLKRRNKLTNYDAYDNINKSLGLNSESTELDWMHYKAKKLLILFYDDSQTVKESDVNKEDFDRIVNSTNTYTYYLKTQLRVKGGNEYIDFIRNLFTSYPIKYERKNGYDLKVYDDCYQMFEDIKKKNKDFNGLCRMLSGLSFNWRKKARDKKSTLYNRDYDFEIDGHKYNWNEVFNASNYITDDTNIDKVGCIYTSQGHDLNYAGVILGEDIYYNPVTKCIEFKTDKFIDANAKSSNEKETIKNIINAYMVLLTRGVYGTYIYAINKELRDYLRGLIS